MYKIFTPGAYLVKDNEKKLAAVDQLHTAEELSGWKSPAHKILVENRETGEKRTWFPGEIMTYVPKKKPKKKTKKKEK